MEPLPKVVTISDVDTKSSIRVMRRYENLRSSQSAMFGTKLKS